MSKSVKSNLVKKVLLISCVEYPPHDVDSELGLRSMIGSSKETSRAAFVAATDSTSRKTLEGLLGYSVAKTRTYYPMRQDAHVEYFKSVLHGYKVVFLQHSRIEYVFSDPDDVSYITAAMNPEAKFHD